METKLRYPIAHALRCSLYLNSSSGVDSAFLNQNYIRACGVIITNIFYENFPLCQSYCGLDYNWSKNQGLIYSTSSYFVGSFVCLSQSASFWISLPHLCIVHSVTKQSRMKCAQWGNLGMPHLCSHYLSPTVFLT